ncbi:MAG: hypothetical protein D6730_21045 [Bacteroidetes bacterium]|nr:MAG: hypothetical protein D6730_21045 [Bacteroidota bacterium]
MISQASTPNSIRLDAFLAEVASALSYSGTHYGASFFLDKETLEVLSITEDMRYTYELVTEDEDALDETPDWMQDAIQPMFLMEKDPERFIPIDRIPSSDAFREMQAFVEEVDDLEVQHHLANSLRQPKPFRRFKDALLDYPEYRECWFEYRDAYEKELAKEWLIDHGILNPEDLGEDPEAY